MQVQLSGSHPPITEVDVNLLFPPPSTLAAPLLQGQALLEDPYWADPIAGVLLVGSTGVVIPQTTSTDRQVRRWLLFSQFPWESLPLAKGTAFSSLTTPPREPAPHSTFPESAFLWA